MLKPRFVRQLTSAERRQIELLFKTAADGRVRRRANIIRLSSLGYTAPQIAEVVGCARQTVRNCFEYFENGGIDALPDAPRSGRPLKATPEYREKLVEAVKSSPKKIGYPFTVWTVVRLRAHMALVADVLLSDSRIRQIMKEENLVFKRPKHSLAKKRDGDAFASVRHLLDELKKSPWNPVPM